MPKGKMPSLVATDEIVTCVRCSSKQNIQNKKKRCKKEKTAVARQLHSSTKTLGEKNTTKQDELTHGTEKQS